MRALVTFAAGVVSGATIAAVTVAAWHAEREQRIRRREYRNGHLVGWVDGIEHHRAELRGLPRALDAAYLAGQRAGPTAVHEPFQTLNHSIFN